MLIKICGITDCRSAQVVEQAGADFIGLVFAPSKRQVNLATVQQIAAVTTLPLVGVFVNEAVATINELVASVPLAYVQLHGNETAATAQQIHAPIIKAFTKAEPIMPFPAVYTLIDNIQAGTGIPYDYQQVALQSNSFLAGGISLTTIDSALACKPCGIDVSSGVETNGKKDAKKIHELISYVRSQTNV